jgi:hypothetical protein
MRMVQKWCSHTGVNAMACIHANQLCFMCVIINVHDQHSHDNKDFEHVNLNTIMTKTQIIKKQC